MGISVFEFSSSSVEFNCQRKEWELLEMEWERRRLHGKCAKTNRFWEGWDLQA